MPVPSQATPTQVDINYDDYREITINGCHEYTFYVKAINYKSLPLDANVREPNPKAKPYKEMLLTLEGEPQKFFENNLGISVIATKVDLLSGKKVRMDFNSGTGILNGGHTQAAIINAQDQGFAQLDKATVRITVRQKDYEESRIAEIAAAQNSCSNVKEYSLAEKRGLNALIKANLDPNKEKSIIWWEGREVPNGEGMDPQDLIAQINVFNIFNYESRYSSSDKQPNISSSSKGTVYKNWENASPEELSNYKAIYPLVNDILDLWEYISFSSVKNTGMTSYDIVKKTEKKDNSNKTLFNRFILQYELPKQMIFVIFAAFRANVYYDANNRKIGWFKDNKELFEATKSSLLTRVKQFFNSTNKEINKFSKTPTIWEVLYKALSDYIDPTTTPVKMYDI